MDSRQLRTFAQVARSGSVSAAAREMKLTQPAVSRQLRQLERAAGLRLLDRGPGRSGVSLTAAGRSLLEAADRVQTSLDAAGDLAATLAAGGVEHVTVAAPATTLHDVLAPFLATLDPDGPLTTVVASPSSPGPRTGTSRVDLTITTAPPPSGTGTAAIAVLPVWAYTRPDDPLAGRADLTLDELAGVDLVLLDPSFRPRQVLDHALAAAGLAPARVIECANAQIALALAASGRGVAVLSDDPRFDLVPHRISTTDPHDGPHLSLTLYASWDPDHHASATLADLASGLREFCAERYGDAVRPHRPSPATGPVSPGGPRPAARRPPARPARPGGGSDAS